MARAPPPPIASTHRCAASQSTTGRPLASIRFSTILKSSTPGAETTVGGAGAGVGGGEGARLGLAGTRERRNFSMVTTVRLRCGKVDCGAAETDVAMVHFARRLAWSWLASSVKACSCLLDLGQLLETTSRGMNWRKTRVLRLRLATLEICTVRPL